MKSWAIFQETETRYFALRRQFETRQITAQQLSAAVQQFRFQDAQGIWWQMQPEDGIWLRWNGFTWDAALPPHRRGPQTLADFFLSILKELFKGLLWKLPLSAGAALVVWAIHTALLVGPNEGLASGKNALLDMILALPGNLISGSLFWAVLVGLSANILARVIKQGMNQTLQNIATTPAWVEYALSGSEGNVLITLLTGCAVALLLGVVLGNRLLSFLMVAMSLGALISQTESLLLRGLHLAWSDSLRLLNRPPRPFNPAWGGLEITGAIFGFMGAVVLPFMPYTGCAGVLFLAGLIALLVLLRQGNRAGSVFLFLWVFILLVSGVSPAQAKEITTSELWAMIAYGILPAFGALGGVVLGLSLGVWDGSSQPISAAAVSASRPVEAEIQPPPVRVPGSLPAQPPPVLSSDEPVILKGQPALDVLVRLGMVRRVITPQGGRYLPLNIDPQGPVSAIAYYQDEQGYLNATIAIAYLPPSTASELIELDLYSPENQPSVEPGQELPVLPAEQPEAPDLDASESPPVESLGWRSDAGSGLSQMMDELPVEDEFKIHLQARLKVMFETEGKVGNGLEYIKLQELGQAVEKQKQEHQWAAALLLTAESLLEYALTKIEPEDRKVILLHARGLVKGSSRFFSEGVELEKSQQVRAALDAIEAALKGL